MSYILITPLSEPTKATDPLESIDNQVGTPFIGILEITCILDASQIFKYESVPTVINWELSGNYCIPTIFLVWNCPASWDALFINLVGIF